MREKMRFGLFLVILAGAVVVGCEALPSRKSAAEREQVEPENIKVSGEAIIRVQGIRGD